MIITWDERKRTANLAKHGLDFVDLTFEFFVAATIYPAGNGRRRAVGSLDGVVVIATVFAPLGEEALAVISMRPASRKERLDAP